jgi:hypothetical protein
MAPFELIWPDELHVPPTCVAYAVMLVCGSKPLTSDIGMSVRFWKPGETGESAK